MMATLANLVVNITGRTIEFEKSLGRVEKRLNYYGRQFQNVGRKITTGFSTPLLLAGVASSKMAIDFESSMSKITGLVGIGSEQVDAWKDSILKMASDVGKAPKELADAMFYITSAGLRGQVALEALRNAAKASVAGLGDMTSIADAVTSAINAYGTSVMDSSKATGTLVAAIREGKLEASTLAPVLGQLLPITSELGVSFGEAAGAVASMSRLGLNASESVTALRGILIALIKPGEKASKILKEQFNTSFVQLRKILREEGLVNLLLTLKDTFKGNEEALAAVFPRAEGLVGLLNLIGANASEANRIINAVANATGEDLNNAFLEASKTAQFKLNLALSQLNSQMVRLGSEVLPIIIPVVSALTEKLRGLFEYLNNLDPAIKRTIVYFGLFAAAIGPVIWAIGTLISSAGAIVTFAKVLLNLGRTSLVALTPMTLAITGMIVAIGLWYTRWQEIKSGLVVIWDFLKEKFIETWNTMIDGIVKAINSIRLLPEKIKEFVISSLKWWKIMETSSTTSVVNTVQKVGESTTGVIEKVKTAMQNTANSLAQTANNVKSTTGTINQAIDTSSQKIKEFENRVASLKQSTASNLGSVTADLMRSKKSFGDWMQSVVKYIAEVIIKIQILKAVAGGSLSPLGGSFLTGFTSGLFRASGGSVSSDQPYIVGERGPELFIPRVSGTIIPNTKLAGAGIGGGININNNIEISGMDFGDKQTLKNIIQALSDQIAQKTAVAVNFAKETYRRGKERNDEA